MAAVSPNFAFLAKHDSLLVTSGAAAERLAFADPAMALARLRLLGEALAKRAAAHTGVTVYADDHQHDVINRLRANGVLRPDVAQLFHGIRVAGNAAVHEGAGTKGQALHQLKMARELAVWFHRAFGGDAGFKPGPFIPPPDPGAVDHELREELDRLQAEVAERQQEADAARRLAEEEAELRELAEAEADAARAEAEAALELAGESEQQAENVAREKALLQRKVEELRARVAAAPAAERQAAVAQAQAAADHIDLSEAETRVLIDAQLREAGWEADTRELTYEQGARPCKGRNIAVAEWPVAAGRADYVLFHGLTALAVVEAKKKTIDVAGAITQAQRYSRDYVVQGDDVLPAGSPWGDYKIPFLCSTNGRPYLKQLETKSGTWFLDVRRSTNHKHALDGWPSPDGLLAKLATDTAAADAALQSSPTSYLPLREYQHEAVKAAEQALAAGQREILVAMATGTGKTRACIGLVYRLLKAKRFNRVLFLVDRSALGDQAIGAFKNVRLEQLQTFTDIYDVKELSDLLPDKDTRLHIATIQGMMRRLLYPAEDTAPLPVDLYDCIVVDECHRGYNLDRELSDAELSFRDESDYISKYRRVLDHFDAVRIGLTATPALHTSQIFGKPVYQYTYRQAVIDGYLVDHEPPIRIVTKLAKEGMTWRAGEEMAVYDTATTQLDLFELPDEVHIEIDEFNRRVITQKFNAAVCGELARHIDPSLPGKTLVFCVNDDHADIVVDALTTAFEAHYGPIDDATVQKITGRADKPRSLILHYKNEQLPKVAVTVDLLTTGIDVPEITNLVFIRRVRSRILFEQMLGRATRLCPEIGKERFFIFDAVDLYAALQDVSSMKPVVTKPNISFERLVTELLEVDEEAAREVLDQLTAKLQAKKRHLEGQQLESFEALAGMAPAALLDELRRGGVAGARAWLRDHPTIGTFLDRNAGKPGRKLIVSDHDDEVVEVGRGYGTGQRPQDYLESFGRFITENMNRLPALLVVTQRPRDLTRRQLKELKLALDAEGYTELALNTAWRETTNQDIAASIIGFIRQRALGSPLISYEKRVDAALERVLGSHAWTQPQRKWLQRIAKQLKVETIVDREALDRGQFKASGGFNRLNKVFDGKLEHILGDIAEALWEETA